MNIRNSRDRLICAIVLAILITTSFLLSACDGSGSDGSLAANEALADFVSNPPAYEDEEPGTLTVEVNGGRPFITKEEIRKAQKSYEQYGNLDKLGRCTSCIASVSTETMPDDDEVRGDISSVHPTGWMPNQGWERCHLIAYCLTAENDNILNLITGTSSMNHEGMLSYEIQTANYVRDSGNHVLYRVTPVYDGDNQIASGVLMEAYSVEDDGKGICFNVYCFNVYPDPNTSIDYVTGEVTRKEASNTSGLTGEHDSHDAWTDEAEHSHENWNDGVDEGWNNDTNEYQDGKNKSISGAPDPDKELRYVLNANSKKIHVPNCTSVYDMKEHNKIYVYDESLEELERRGYEPCGSCHAGRQ